MTKSPKKKFEYQIKKKHKNLHNLTCKRMTIKLYTIKKLMPFKTVLNKMQQCYPWCFFLLLKKKTKNKELAFLASSCLYFYIKIKNTSLGLLSVSFQ
jgi:hypothetical protein